MDNRISDHVADRLLDQSGVCAQQGQVGGQSDVDLLTRAAPPDRTGNAIDNFAQVDPIAPQLQRPPHRSG